MVDRRGIDDTTIPSRLSKTRHQPPSEVQGHCRPQSLAEGGRDQQRQDTVGRAARVVGICEARVHRGQSGLFDLGGLKRKGKEK